MWKSLHSLLKQMRTNLNFCVIGLYTAAIFLSNDQSLYRTSGFVCLLKSNRTKSVILLSDF